MEPFDSYLIVIENLTRVVDAITEIEQKKGAAAAENKPGLLDEQIRREQAEILKMRGLEQNRARLGQALGWDQLTFRQILETVLPGQEKQLAPVFSRLLESIRALERAKDASDRMLKARLHEIELLAAQAGIEIPCAEWRI